VGVFVVSYPYQWNVAQTPDRSSLGVGIYAVGLVVTAAATGAALVGHQVERVALLAERGEGDTEATTDDAQSVSDEDVQRDIDEAMADAELTWGGVERAETTRLKFNTDVDGVETNAGEVGASKTRTEGENVDDAVSSLRSLQGRDDNVASSEATVDEQTAALTELKQRQEAESAADASEGRADGGGGLLNRIKNLLSR
jgi:hypothetical protein